MALNNLQEAYIFNTFMALNIFNTFMALNNLQEDLALNNLQEAICHKIQPTKPLGIKTIMENKQTNLNYLLPNEMLDFKSLIVKVDKNFMLEEFFESNIRKYLNNF